jgi:hypothetical protein
MDGLTARRADVVVPRWNRTCFPWKYRKLIRNVIKRAITIHPVAGSP